MTGRHPDLRRTSWTRDVRADLLYAARTCRSEPRFVAVAVLLVAVGIGANTAIFSVSEALLLRSLPVQRPHDLVFLVAQDGRGGGSAPPYPYLQRFRAEASSFTGVAAFATDELRVTIDGRPEQVFGQVTSGSYFDLLGLEPAAGRLMTADDERLDPPVAVLGYGYWQRRFGGRRDVIGRSISFDDRTYTIIGVTPRSFWGLEPGRQVDVTLPITQSGLVANADAQWFTAVARLRPGVSIAQATADTNAIFRSFMEDRDRAGERWRSGFVRAVLPPAAHGLSQLRSRFWLPLSALTALAGVLLLITCANLGGLLMIRGATRAREFAVRLAIGAGFGRLLRQVLTETVLLFVLGALVGLAIAYVAVQGLTDFFASGRRPVLLDVRFNWWVAAYAILVTSIAALCTGLWPALRASRTDPYTAMKNRDGHVAGMWSLATGRLIVAGQVALSLALLVSAVVFARTMANLRAVDLGFTPGRVLTLSVRPEVPRGTSDTARAQLWTRILDQAQSISGIHAASLSVLTPLSGRNTGTALAIPGRASRGDVRLNHVSEDYFRVFGIQLVEGRSFSRNDAPGGARVAVLSQSAARAAFGDEPAIGRMVQLGDAAVYQVVGVVRDHKHVSVRETTTRFAFVPLWQPIEPIARLTLAVSSDESSLSPGTPRRRSSLALVSAVSDEVRAIHPDTLISDVIGVDDQIDATLMSERLLAALSSVFAVVVLAVATIGLYAIVSFSIARRKAELGIRLALGAPRMRVASGVIGEVLLQAGVGIAIGVPLAVAIARAAGQLLFGVTAADPANYIGGAAIMIAVACAAAWLPAQRACSIDPAEVLRRS